MKESKKFLVYCNEDQELIGLRNFIDNVFCIMD